MSPLSPTFNPHGIAVSLAKAWRKGSTAPASLIPAGLSVAEAIDIEARAFALTGMTAGAWKLGATTHASKNALWLDSGFIGPVPAHRAHFSPARLPAAALQSGLIECELAVKINLARWLSEEETNPFGFIESVHAAFELPESRFASLGEAGPCGLIADFGAAGAAVIAEGGAPPDILGDAAALFPTELRVNGARVASGDGNALLEPPLVVLSQLKELFRLFPGERNAEEYILLGSMTPSFRINKGETAVATIDGVGSVTLTVE